MYNLTALQSDVDVISNCADSSGASNSTMLVLAILGAVLGVASEGLSLTERVRANGVLHGIWHFVCESGCMARHRDPTNPNSPASAPQRAVPVVVGEQQGME